jgi:hypothetical protein
MADSAYRVSNPDYHQSPYTGMTRRHYIECAKYLLERAFKHVPSLESMLVFPVVAGKTYPQPGDPAWRYRSLEFEGLRRTMALAGPLMHAEPEVTIHGIKLRDYYCLHLYNALTPGHPNSIPLPEELPDATYQFTCELGGLCMFLLMMPDIIWPYYTKEQQDAIAATLSKWAHHRTTQNNWRFFNIEMMSFLKKNGYPVDEELLKSHLLWIASYHAGNGWYLEQNYNYYTISMYSIYEMVWCRAFGDEYWPEIAAVYERNTRRLMDSYPYLFGRDGFITMWSRSICYRLWVAGGFPVAFILNPPYPLDGGWSRRLCSGAILQFVTREDFYMNDVPSLGFYGHSEYMLQGYSCAASPFTMFMPFLTLALPEDSPFWTDTENEGFWSELGERSRVTVLDKPGLMLVNHGKTGTSEIRSAKVNEEDHNYNRLCYNTHFPWEDHQPDGGTAMEYNYRSLDPRDVEGRDALFYLGLTSGGAPEKGRADFVTPQSVLYNGVRGEVLYRQLIMRRPPNNGSGYIIDLAEIALPGGTLRIDRCRLAYEHELTLGHFGLPHYGGQPAVVKQSERDGKQVITAAIPGRQVALVSYGGWDETRSLRHNHCNAETEESTVVYAYRKRTAQNPPMELMITAMLHKLDDSEWTDDELFPVKHLEIRAIMPSGSPLGAVVTLKDGTVYEIDFKEIDGDRQC